MIGGMSATPRSPQERLSRLLAWRERCQGNRRRGERCASSCGCSWCALRRAADADDGAAVLELLERLRAAVCSGSCSESGGASCLLCQAWAESSEASRSSHETMEGAA
jgi:hypothetical protein